MPDIKLMVDASCDLPQELIQELGIVLVPNHVQIGANAISDDRDTARTLRFFNSGFDAGREHADVAPTPPQDYLNKLRELAMLTCDELLILAPLKELSRSYDNANTGTVNAATSLLVERAKVGRKEIFRVNVADSRNIFAPHGLVAWELAAAIREGASMHEVVAKLKVIAQYAMGYYAMDNLRYIVGRARDKRDRPNAVMLAIGTLLDVKPIIRRQGNDSTNVAKVRTFEASVNRVFQRITRLINDGDLVVPRVVVAYGGPVAELDAFEGYLEVKEVAQQHDVSIATSCMSMTTGIFMGRRSLGIGLAANPHQF